MKRRKSFWFRTLCASLLLSTGGCAGLQSLPSAPVDQTARSTSLVPSAGPSSDTVSQRQAERTGAANAVVPSPTGSDISTTAAEPRTAPADEPQGLTLVGAIQIALAANPDIHSATARLELAESILARARAEFFPRLTLGEDVDASNNPANVFAYHLSQGRFDIASDPGRPPVAYDFHTQLGISEDLYTGGRRIAQRRSAQAGLDASRFSLAEVQNDLVFHVAEAYYRLLQAQAFLGVRQQAVEQVRHQLEVVSARVRAGSAVRSDALRVEVRLAEEEVALVTAKTRLELAWALLERVMGTHVDPHVLPEGVPAAPWSEHVDKIEAIVAEANARRPELGKLARNKQAAEHDMRAARAAAYPTVNLMSSYDLHTEDFATGNQSFFVGVAVRLIVMDCGRTASDMRQAKARLHELEAKQASQVLEIELDVRRAYLQLVDAQERLRVTTKAVSLAEVSLSDMQARYRGQSALLTDLIDVQVALTNARVRRANAAADVEIARALLERAAGRLTSIGAGCVR